jgi:hypothetical protein
VSDAPQDPIAWLKTLAQSATRIRLAPGVLGKTHTVMMGAMVLWAIALLRLSATELWLDVALLTGAGITTAVAWCWCRQAREFAVANPALALMEGADITEYQRFEAEAKGLLGRGSPLISDPTKQSPDSAASLEPDVHV